MSHLAVVPLSTGHDKSIFDCGAPALNDYLRRFARQNEDTGISRTFIGIRPTEPRRIVGYYSLAATSIAFERVPEETRKKLPRYPVPAALLARLAADRAEQGRGIGSVLLVDAYKRVLSAAESLGIGLLVIHAKDDTARRFYMRFNAIPVADEPLHLIVDLRVIRALAGK